MRKTLIAEYHRSLAEDEGLTAGFFARLKTMMQERRLLYGAREIGVALRPHVLTRTQYAILSHASEVVAGAFEKIASALLSEPSRMEKVGLTEREIKLALVAEAFGLNSDFATRRFRSRPRSEVRRIQRGEPFQV